MRDEPPEGVHAASGPGAGPAAQGAAAHRRRAGAAVRPARGRGPPAQRPGGARAPADPVGRAPGRRPGEGRTARAHHAARHRRALAGRPGRGAAADRRLAAGQWRRRPAGPRRRVAAHRPQATCSALLAEVAHRRASYPKCPGRGRVAPARRPAAPCACPSPACIADEAWLRQLYGDHPYGREHPARRRGARRARGLAARRAPAARRAAGSLLVLVGDLTPARALDQVAAALAGWDTAGSPTSVPKVPAVVPGPLRLVDRPGAVQSNLRIGGDGAGPHRPVVRRGRGGQRPVRRLLLLPAGDEHPRGQGLHLQPAELACGTRRWPRCFLTAADVATEVTAPALVEIGYELGPDGQPAAVRRGGAATAQYLVGTLALSTATQAGLAGDAGRAARRRARRDLAARAPAALLAVTPEQVHEVAQQLLAPARPGHHRRRRRRPGRGTAGRAVPRSPAPDRQCRPRRPRRRDQPALRGPCMRSTVGLANADEAAAGVPGLCPGCRGGMADVSSSAQRLASRRAYRLVRPAARPVGRPGARRRAAGGRRPPRRAAARAGRAGHRQDHDARRGRRRPHRGRRRPRAGAGAHLRPPGGRRAARPHHGPARPRATKEPLARTFHSYAFGVLRREAAAARRAAAAAARRPGAGPRGPRPARRRPRRRRRRLAGAAAPGAAAPAGSPRSCATC